MPLTASKDYYRFVLLLFNGFVNLGGFCCADMPSVLQGILQAPASCNTTVSDCTEGLGLNPKQYNMLYAVYSWGNAVAVLGAGYLVDKLGNQFGLFVFSVNCLLGTTLFAIGTMLHETSAMLPVMLLGRLLLGCGVGPLYTVQCRLTSVWFRDKELAFGYGVLLSFSRIGSVLNFFWTKKLANEHGLTSILWLAVLLVLISFAAAIITSALDVYGMKQLGQESFVKSESAKVRLEDAVHFSSLFWSVALSITFCYCLLFAFVADSSEYIKVKYNYSEESLTPSRYNAALYSFSLITSPLFGLVIDHVGMRSIIMLCCGFFTIPQFTILAFTNLNPLVCTLWLGFLYAIASTTMLSSLPLVVPAANVGTALGLVWSLSMIGVGISNVIVGEILGDKDDNMSRWRWVMIYLLGLAIAYTISSAAVSILDWKKAGILNATKKQVHPKKYTDNSIVSTDYDDESLPLVPMPTQPKTEK